MRGTRRARRRRKGDCNENSPGSFCCSESCRFDAAGDGLAVISGFHWKVVNFASPGAAEPYGIIGGHLHQARAAHRQRLPTKASPSLPMPARAAAVMWDLGWCEKNRAAAVGGTVVVVWVLKKKTVISVSEKME